MGTSRKGSRWEPLRRRSAALRRSLENLVREIEQLTAEPSADAILAADVLEDETKKWEEIASGLGSRVENLLGRFRARRDEELETFDQRLARELTGRGHQVHGEAGLFIVDGIVHVETSLQRRVVRVNGASVSDLWPAAVVDRVAEEARRLSTEVARPGEMLAHLLMAYQRELRLTGEAPCSQLPATSIQLQIALLRQRPAFAQNPTAGNYREYSREQFRADLYTLLSSGNLVTGGVRFHHTSGADTAGAIFMLVPALGRPAYVGRIWFEAEQ